MLDFLLGNPEIEEISLPVLKSKNVQLFIKREDRIHPEISGNKFRKLKYNLIKAKAEGYTQILTFGGAYSNHIAAVAAAGRYCGFKTIGVIRGEELEGNIQGNTTLTKAQEDGMTFKFVSRSTYREKHYPEFIKSLNDEFELFYMIPEGGTNDLAVKGCKEILSNVNNDFNVICCSVGTGGTISGLINCSKLRQQVLGFPALKGSFLQDDIRKFVSKQNWKLITDYHFGGYAKFTEELIFFINDFNSKTGILLDPIYTGKMMFGVLDMIKKDAFKQGSRILTIHTGGLQGISGCNALLKKRNLPLIRR